MTERRWKADTRLFWFLKEGATLDLENPRDRDRLVQQVLLRGGDREDIELLGRLRPKEFQDSFDRIKDFVPADIRRFWEKYVADHLKPAERTSGIAR